MLPDAVIFDVDGLLVDTETPDYEAWRELHEAYGLELTLAEYCENAGLYGTWERMYGELSGRCGRSPQELHALREPRFRELVGVNLRPDPELTALLSRLRRAGVRVGIASSSDADWVSYLLDGMNLRQEFQTVVTGHNVRHRKPAPEVYLLAAEWLGVDPQHCVALEDSTHGIEAARAAGMRVIAMPNPVSTHQDLSRADARVLRFGEVTLGLLQDLCSRPGNKEA